MWEEQPWRKRGGRRGREYLGRARPGFLGWKKDEATVPGDPPGRPLPGRLALARGRAQGASCYGQPARVAVRFRSRRAGSSRAPIPRSDPHLGGLLTFDTAFLPLG